jgi:Putative adhesin
MRVSPWGRVVAISALLVVGGAVALAIGALASTRERVVSYPVTGALRGVAFDLADGAIVIVGGGRRDAVTVQRTERFAFGHDAESTRSVQDGVFRVRSRCPTSTLGKCTVAYRVTVPDNLPVEVRTGSGSVEMSHYRGSATLTTGSGDIRVAGFCGFSLDARAQSGDVDAQTACAPPKLSLRTNSGSVTALVPAGSYDLDAESASGAEHVRGVRATQEAPFAIRALSGSGDVTVEGRT